MYTVWLTQNVFSHIHFISVMYLNCARHTDRHQSDSRDSWNRAIRCCRWLRTLYIHQSKMTLPRKKTRHKTQNRMENEFSRWFTTLRRVKKTWHIYELMQQSAGIISFHFIFVSACRHQNEHTFIAPIVLRRRIEQTLVMLCAPCVQCTHPWKSKFHSTFSSSGVSTVAFWIAYQPSSQLVWATVSACVTESRFAM